MIADLIGVSLLTALFILLDSANLKLYPKQIGTGKFHWRAAWRYQMLFIVSRERRW